MNERPPGSSPASGGNNDPTLSLTPDSQAPTRLQPTLEDTNPRTPSPEQGEQRPVDARSPAGYVIEHELGRGGMGVVYLARSLELQRPCALKMILSGVHANQTEIRRFRTEAQSAARLQHPGIVQVFEIGEHHDASSGAINPFMALEYCSGGSLDSLLAKNPLPAKDAAGLVQALAVTIQAAHDAKVIHRDLKPANVLLTDKREPKVTDFGLAKKLDEPGLTATGAIMGTPSYMPPEQAEGQSDIGPSADIYALGAILYECLTGRPPFKAATKMDTLRQVLTDEPVQVRALNASVPADLETIALKCLQKDPGKRYASAQALADDLGRWLRGEPIQARPVGALERAIKWVRRHAVISALLAVVLMVVTTGVVASWVLTGWAMSEASAARIAEQAARTAETVAEQEAKAAREAEEEAKQREKAEAQAKQLAQTEKERADAEAKAARKAEAEAQTQKVRAENQLRRAEWSVYAGKLLLAQAAFNENNMTDAFRHLEECQWNLRGWEHAHLRWRFHSSKQTLKGHNSGVLSVAFSPDGKRILTGSQDKTARVWDAQNGNLLLTLQGHTNGVTSVAFSPDGKRILTGSSDKTAKVWDAEKGQEILTFKGHTFWVTSVAWTPDGKHILTGSGDHTAKLWDAEKGTELLTLKGHTDWVTSVAFSPDGKRILTGSNDKTAKVWDADKGSELLTLKGHARNVSGVCFSPDGKRILTGSHDKTARVWDAQNGNLLFTLQGHTDKVTSVAWTPDGKRILTGSEDKTAKMWDAEKGTNLLTFQEHAETLTSVAFSHDGKRILTGSHDKTARVWDAENGTDLLTLKGHTDSVYSVCFSPDGKRILTGSRDSTAKVWDAEKGTELLTLKGHTAEIYSVAWSPDGKRILTGSGDTTAKLWDAEKGTDILTFRGHTAEVLGVAFSPDGKRILTGSGDTTAKLWDAEKGTELVPRIRIGL